MCFTVEQVLEKMFSNDQQEDLEEVSEEEDGDEYNPHFFYFIYRNALQVQYCSPSTQHKSLYKNYVKQGHKNK